MVDPLKQVEYQDTPEIGLREFLALFPRLETCFLDSRFREIWDEDDTKTDAYFRSYIKTTAKDIRILTRRGRIHSSYSVSIIQKFVYSGERLHVEVSQKALLFLLSVNQFTALSAMNFPVKLI